MDADAAPFCFFTRYDTTEKKSGKQVSTHPTICGPQIFYCISTTDVNVNDIFMKKKKTLKIETMHWPNIELLFY